MVTVAQAALGGAAIVGAGVLEELTHLAAARPWASRQTIRFRGGAVMSEVPNSTPQIVDKWVSLAPFFVGLVALTLLYLGRGLPPLSDETVLLYVAWGWYTTPSLTDLQAALGESSTGDPWDDPRYRGVWMGFSIETVGLLLCFGWDELYTLLGGQPFGSGLIAPADYALMAYLQRAGVGVAFAGAVWMFVRIELARKSNG